MKQRQRVQAIIIQNNKVLFGAGMLKGKEYRHFFIDGVYFKILLEECNNRNYFPEWYGEMKRLVESYIM